MEMNARTRIGQLALALVLASTSAAQVTQRVSVDSAGAEGRGEFFHPSISANGRFVAFTNAGIPLASGDTNPFTDVLVRDRLLGTTERISVSSAGLQGNGHSRWYFVYYRDGVVLGGCPSTSTFNATQTGVVSWSP